MKPKSPIAFIESPNYSSGGPISPTVAGHEANRWSGKEPTDWLSVHMVQKMLKIHSFRLFMQIQANCIFK